MKTITIANLPQKKNGDPFQILYTSQAKQHMLNNRNDNEDVTKMNESDLNGIKNHVPHESF